MARPAGTVEEITVQKIKDGEEVKLKIGGARQRSWAIIHKLLDDGVPIRLSGLANPSVQQVAINGWVKRHRHKNPRLKLAHTVCLLEEGAVLVYFDPYL